MIEPLALVVYEKLLPGTQLVNRLQDLKYRVKAITDVGTLVDCARQEKPLIILADVFSSRGDICQTIARLRKDRDAQHIPVIAFAADESADTQTAARDAGATPVGSDTAQMKPLPQFPEKGPTV